MRRIDADKLIEVFAEKKEVWRGNGVLPSNESLMWLAAMDITSNAPTVDAVPVKHGRWVYEADGIGDYSHCSICECRVAGGRISDLSKRYKFCPNCGAKMDEQPEPPKEN